MGLAAEKTGVTAAEYLRDESTAGQRHEFVEGRVLAMAGGTHQHSRITANVVAFLHPALKDRSRYPLGSDMRLRIPRRLVYVYPDVSVVCGKAEFDPDDPRQRSLTNPKLVVEVLSESTESYDRGEKFSFYRDIPSLTEYVLISQTQPSVETFLRQDDGGWSFHSFTGGTAVARLRSLGIDLPLADVYAGIDFDPAAQP